MIATVIYLGPSLRTTNKLNNISVEWKKSILFYCFFLAVADDYELLSRFFNMSTDHEA